MPLIRRIYSKDWFVGYMANIDIRDNESGSHSNSFTSDIAPTAWSMPNGSGLNSGTYTGQYLVDADNTFFYPSLGITPGNREYAVLQHGHPIRGEDAYTIDFIWYGPLLANATPGSSVIGPGIFFSAEWLDTTNNEVGDCYMVTLNLDPGGTKPTLNFYQHVYAGGWTWNYIGSVELATGFSSYYYAVRLVQFFQTPKMSGVPTLESMLDYIDVYYHNSEHIDAVSHIEQFQLAKDTDLKFDIRGVCCHADTDTYGRHGEPRLYCGAMWDSYTDSGSLKLYYIAQGSWWDQDLNTIEILERINPRHIGNAIVTIQPAEIHDVFRWRRYDDVEVWVNDNSYGRRVALGTETGTEPWVSLYFAGKIGKWTQNPDSGDVDGFIMKSSLGYANFRGTDTPSTDGATTFSAGDNLQIMPFKFTYPTTGDQVGQPGGVNWWKLGHMSGLTWKNRGGTGSWTPIASDRTYLGISYRDIIEIARSQLGYYVYETPEGEVIMSDTPRDMTSYTIAPVDPTTGNTDPAFLYTKRTDGGNTIINHVQVYGDTSSSPRVYAEARNTTSVGKYGLRSLDPPYIDPEIGTNAEASIIANNILNMYVTSVLPQGIAELETIDIYTMGWIGLRPGDKFNLVDPNLKYGTGGYHTGDESTWSPETVFCTERHLKYVDTAQFVRFRVVATDEFFAGHDILEPSHNDTSNKEWNNETRWKDLTRG